jgi:hypothetical protein
MTRRGIHGLVLASLALALSAAGCKKSDTVLFVTVYNGPDADPKMLPYQFYVNVTAGLETHSLDVPKELNPASAITLPTSFTISIDRAHTGPIIVTVNAKALDRSTFAAGTATADHPVIGGQTLIAVELSPTSAPTGPDGGTGGAGTGGGGTGGSGGAGTGGSAGQGGTAAEAGAPDAPQDATDAHDAADGMGLDVAAD